MPDSHPLDRRDFVKVVTAFLGTIMGAVIGLPAVGYMLSPALKETRSDAKIAAGPLENYPEGTPTLFTFTRTKTNGWERTVNSYGVYIIRQGQSVKVISNRCTHLSCRVKWIPERNEYHCPCHDAAFNLDGSVKSGPPPTPLDDFSSDVSVEDGNIFFVFKGG